MEVPGSAGIGIGIGWRRWRRIHVGLHSFVYWRWCFKRLWAFDWTGSHVGHDLGIDVPLKARLNCLEPVQ
jgi:hypothetical protein